jgi:phosphate transport system substrate-binding protein
MVLRPLIVAFTCSAATLALSACSGSSGGPSQTTVTVDGSTALQPLVTQAAIDYMAKHPDVKIDIKGGGSAKGIFDASAHSVDIGDSDVDAAVPDLTDHQVAVAAFAIVSGPNTGVKSLSTSQISEIFTGKVTNWSQVGGRDQKIAVFNRPLGSGTRKVFSTVFLGGREPDNKGEILQTSEAVAQKVKNTPGSISYVALSYATKFNVPPVDVAGVTPSVANIHAKKYPFWSYEHMYTTSKSSPAAGAFIDYVRSDDGAIDSLGFIAIKDVARLASSAPSAQ